MSSQVRVVKKQNADASVRGTVKSRAKNEQQRNREIVGVIRSWIEEFRLRTTTSSQAALVRLTK